MKSIVSILIITSFSACLRAQPGNVSFMRLAINYAYLADNPDSLKARFEISDSQREDLLFASGPEALPFPHSHDSASRYIYLSFPNNRSNASNATFVYEFRIVDKASKEQMQLYFIGQLSVFSTPDLIEVNGLHFQKGTYLFQLTNSSSTADKVVPENYHSLVSYRQERLAEHLDFPIGVTSIASLNDHRISESKMKKLLAKKEGGRKSSPRKPKQ